MVVVVVAVVLVVVVVRAEGARPLVRIRPIYGYGYDTVRTTQIEGTRSVRGTVRTSSGCRIVALSLI